MTMHRILSINLRAFDGTPNTQTTLLDKLSPEMQDFYDKALIHAAQPELVHAQFGQKKPIPANNGKTIQFRKFVRLPKLTKPLTEGVTPDGQAIEIVDLEQTVQQYGGYVTLSDVLQLTARDPMLTETTMEIGAQGGLTLDTVIRESLNAGTNVQYAEGQVGTRNELTADHKMTVKAVKMAANTLKKAHASKIDGDYIGIVHPDVSFDLTEDPEWKYPRQYVDPEAMYEGEIGKIHGVRFVETTEAKIFDGGVYSTLILGANAYGVIDIAGGGMKTIVKPNGSGGTSDPLDQRATVGWKGMQAALIISDEYIVRVETKSTFNGDAN